MFVILQKYDFSSKSQRVNAATSKLIRCLWYCKSTIFQANHNRMLKEIPHTAMFVILQKYDFSSKSQLYLQEKYYRHGCLWYCKSTIFQANHNAELLGQQTLTMFVILQKYDFSSKSQPIYPSNVTNIQMFVILQKYDFSSKSQRLCRTRVRTMWCLWYCKSTIFQANHNGFRTSHPQPLDVCDTAKVRFFKQITTTFERNVSNFKMFVILQKYDFSSKSQQCTANHHC